MAEEPLYRIARALEDLVEFHRKTLTRFINILEGFMSTTQTGLAALQTFVTSFQAFATQQTTDLATLTANITAAITALQNSNSSEDPQVQAAVTSLQSALTTVQSNESSLEALSTSLGTAENPAPASNVAKK